MDRRQGALPRFGIGALRCLGDIEWHPESHLGCPGMASLMPGFAVLLDIGAEFRQGKNARRVNDNGIPQAPNEGKVTSDVIPTRMGGWGFCTGLGRTHRSSHW